MNATICIIIDNIIRAGYHTRSNILINIATNIDKLDQDGIIHHTQYQKCMNLIKCYTHELNSIYDEHTSRKLTVHRAGDLIYSNVINGHNNGYIYRDLDKKIILLMNDVGSMRLFDIFKLTLDESYWTSLYQNATDEYSVTNSSTDYQTEINVSLCGDIKASKNIIRKMHTSFCLLNLLDNTFNPIEIYVHDGGDCDSILIKQFCSKNDNETVKYEVLLDNCYKITIRMYDCDKTFVIFGYFKQDTTRSIIATSRICNKLLHFKQQFLIKHVREKCNHVEASYQTAYIDSLSIGDILSHNEISIVAKLNELYEMYTRSTNLKFKVIVNEFLQAELYQKYMILKCLLLGSPDSVRNGTMLFGMTKDQSRDVRNNMVCVADILHKHLDHNAQIHLKKSEHYLKQKLDQIKQLCVDEIDLRQQCAMCTNIDNRTKKCVFDRLDEMNSNKNEYYKNLLFVKTIIDFPWIPENYVDSFTIIGKNKEKCREKIDQIKADIDTIVFGHTECKNTICENVGKWLSNPASTGKSLGLWGPPGVGKTLIAMSLGKSLKIPYQEIHLGGLEDGAVLSGHSFTYSAAQPGLIVTKMVQAGEPRVILFFDELDKTCVKHGINEIFNVLIHATDPNTNGKFNDKFFQDVTFPLSKCIFIFSFNDKSKIDPILLDRMEIIEIKPYSVADKVQIATKYMWPLILKEIGVSSDFVKITENQIVYIINNHTTEAGVRTLKTQLEKLVLKLNIDRIYDKGPFAHLQQNWPLTISQKYIEKSLGKSNNQIVKIHNEDNVGIINGLFATNSGYGGIIPIIVYSAKDNEKKFKLCMTGKQGAVMQESINFAWILAKNCVKNEYIKKFYETNMGGLHVHTPDGATPKDGPSAGLAFAIAFISRIMNFPIKHNIATTAELGINGSLMAIGGLEYKLSGAKMAGVKLVCVCKNNMDDIKKIQEVDPTLFVLLTPRCPKKSKKVCDFYVIIVNNIFEVIEYALIDPEYVKIHYVNKIFDVYDKTSNYRKFLSANVE